MKERATELEYLTWFRTNADFGPGEADYIDALNARFMRETGKNLPEGWNYLQDGKTSTDSEAGITLPPGSVRDVVLN